MIVALFFYLFAGICVASAFMVIAARNPVHSVLYLILAFVNAAGLFVMMGAEFLAMILIVVYVGAVAVLFLFVVMMLDVDFAELKQGVLQYLPVGMLIGGIFLAELLLVVGGLGDRPAAAAGDHRADSGEYPEYRGDRARSLYALRLFLRGGGHDPAGRHGRRDRADFAAPRARAPPGHRRAGRAHAGSLDRDRQGPVGAGAGEQYMTIGLGHYLVVAAILFTTRDLRHLPEPQERHHHPDVDRVDPARGQHQPGRRSRRISATSSVRSTPLFVLTVAAAEAAIGLAILVVFYRNRGSIAVEDINLMKG